MSGRVPTMVVHTNRPIDVGFMPARLDVCRCTSGMLSHCRHRAVRPQTSSERGWQP
jgi:hypothetical protein